MSMTSTFVPAVVGAAFVALGTLGATDVFDKIGPQDPPNVSLKQLTFEDGFFTQEHFVGGPGTILMDWAAEIDRGPIQLCGGGGRAPYENGALKNYTPDEWTGGSCPPLQPGDQAFGVWEYTNVDGTRVRVSGTLVLTADML